MDDCGLCSGALIKSFSYDSELKATISTSLPCPVCCRTEPTTPEAKKKLLEMSLKNKEKKLEDIHDRVRLIYAEIQEETKQLKALKCGAAC